MVISVCTLPPDLVQAGTGLFAMGRNPVSVIVAHRASSLIHAGAIAIYLGLYLLTAV